MHAGGRVWNTIGSSVLIYHERFTSGVTFAFRCHIHSILPGGPRLGLAMDTDSPTFPRMAVIVVPPAVSPSPFSFWTPDEDIGDADDDFRIIRADPMGYYVQRRENGRCLRSCRILTRCGGCNTEVSMMLTLHQGEMMMVWKVSYRPIERIWQIQLLPSRADTSDPPTFPPEQLFNFHDPAREGFEA